VFALHRQRAGDAGQRSWPAGCAQCFKHSFPNLPEALDVGVLSRASGIVEQVPNTQRPVESSLFVECGPIAASR